MIDLAECAGVEECLERVAARARELRDSGSEAWVLAHGARVAAWREGAWPSAAQLDAAAGDRPCAVMSFDHHSLAANSAALRAAGWSDASGDPAGGVLVRDDRGRLTGVCLESAAQAVWAAAPEPTGEQWRDLIRRALAELAKHGFTEIHDLLSPDWLGPELARLDDAGELGVAVRLFAPLERVEIQKLASASWERPNVRLVGGKIFVDGTLNGRTAWMLSPYADPLPGRACGTPLFTEREIAVAIRRCRSLGLGLAAHAIGDGAVRACLDGVELAGGASAKPAGDVRVEHCELIDVADVPRMARLGVVASVQPCHLLYDIEALRRSLPHRLDRVMPWRELIDSGLTPGERLLFGSDVPVARANPEDSIRAAVDRRRAGTHAAEAIAPGQGITEREAWACFGRGGFSA